ncbi:DUF6708 domain-containing protein [Caballeronia sordidicola]|nr:DUF6708 domain-containing protein [Caballeronia sordidicola]
MNVTKVKKIGWWARHIRKASAYGPLDRAVRQWRGLGSVRTSTGTAPNGDALVYGMNATTLEIGQGAHTFKGMIGLAGLGGALAAFFALFIMSPDFISFATSERSWGLLTWTIFLDVVIFFPMGLLFLTIFLTDFFGYTDALLRFDRVRRKVWMFVGTRSPIELDWDRLTPVSQGITPANSNVNTFRSVLLVDLDAEGDVKFDGKYPRIASIGQTSLNEQQAISQYEYVRQFMELGPTHLPSCETYLEHRTVFRDIVRFFGFLDLARNIDWRRPGETGGGLLVLASILCMLLGWAFLPFDLATYIAYRCNRVPKWPAKIEAYAKDGGEMTTPVGAASGRMRIVLKEVPFILLWVGCAFAVYAWVASWFIK